MKIKTYAIDIDGVICKTYKSDYERSTPNLHIIDKINSLHTRGHRIVIFTARFMGRTNNNYKEAYKLGYEFTIKQLQSWNVKFDKLIMGKPSFDILIDDKAFNYSENWLKEID